MRLIAPAKINWTLEVLGRRADGYHEVRSVMQTIDLCDEVALEPAEKGPALAVEGAHAASADDPSAGSGQDLALRAACLLAEAADRRPDVSIRLTKRVPAGAGLGGGSSDAAAVLRGLRELWALGWERERLAEIAARTGSDVPFFLYGGTALAEGRGERVTPLPEGPQAWLVLLVPPFQVPQKTRRMYQALAPADFGDGSATGALVRRLAAGQGVDESYLRNAFERAAFEVFPGLAAYREALLGAGARRVHLAGSGPALFALSRDEGEARDLLERLKPPGGRAFLSRTLSPAEALAVRV